MSLFFTRLELCRSQKANDLGIDNSCPKDLERVLGRTCERMDGIRDFLGYPVKVHSGFRCPSLNKAVGGSKTSQHLTGQAVDFTCPVFGTPVDIFAALLPRMEEFGIDQLILEPGWIHVSFTERPRLQAIRSEVGGRYVAVNHIGFGDSKA